MAAAKRFHSEYTSELGTDYAVEIWDTSFVGASTEFNLGEGGFKLRYTGEAQERMTEIIGSECTAVMHLITPEHDAFVADLITSSEGRFFLKVTYGASPVLFWAGVILADNSRLPDEIRAQFEFRAIDGLGALRLIEYKNGSNAYFGDVRIGQHVTNCLNKLSYITEFFPAGTTLLRTSVDWWESTMGSVTNTTDPFYKAWLDHATFWDYDNKGQKKFLNCYEVLKNILTAFGCRIYQVEGSFRIEQISYRISTSFYSRKYDSTFALLGAETLTGVNTLDQTTSGAKLAKMQFEWFPSLAYVSCEQMKFNRRNLLAGYSIIQSTAQIATYNQVESNSSNSALRFSAQLKMDIKNVSYVGSTFDNLIFVFAMKMKVGAQSVYRNYTIQNFQVNYQAAAWAADSISNWVYIGQPIWPTPAVGSTTHYETAVQFISPPLPTSGYFEFDFNLVAVTKFDGSGVFVGDFTTTFVLDNPYVEVYNGLAPDVDEDSVYFSATNPVATNTAKYEMETRIGDSTNPNTVGRIKVGANASSLTSAVGWGAGSSARSSVIADLLCLTTLKGQLLPTYKMMGTVYGTFALWKKYVDSEGRQWLMLGGTFTAQRDELNGEWFELLYGGGGVSQTPVKKKYDKFHQSPFPTSLPGNNNGLGTNSELQIKPPGTVLLPVATTSLSASKAAGAVTSLSITDTLAFQDFYVGDKIALFNPVSNTFDTLTVTASSTGGATTIAVSGTLTTDYPQGSYIIKKPIIGHPTLFGQGTVNKVAKFVFGNEVGDSNITDSGSAVAISYLAGVGSRMVIASSAGVLSTAAIPSGLADGDYGDITVSSSGTAWTIDANAVTLAKMAQVVTQTFLGRTSASTGNVEALTVTQATAMLNVFSATLKGLVPLSGGGTANYLRADGTWAAPPGTATGVTQATTLTAGRVTLSSGSNSVTDHADLRWNGSQLTIGSGTPAAFLNVYAGALSGTQEFLRMSANVNGNMFMSMLNASTFAAGNTLFQIATGSATAGDPAIQFTITGVASWAMGIDNSDADKFKITPLSSTPGGVANSGVVITQAAAASVGINTDTPARPLHVVGMARSSGFENASALPTIAYGTGAGTGASTVLITGGGNCVNLTFTTGATAPVLNGNICTITLPSPVFFANDCVPVFSPSNDITTTHLGRFRVGGTSQNNFLLVNTGTALTASTTYSLKIVVFGY